MAEDKKELNADELDSVAGGRHINSIYIDASLGENLAQDENSPQEDPQPNTHSRIRKIWR